jgi:hypothetical protein
VPLIDSLLRSNDSHIDHAFRLIAEAGAKRVGLLGVTFKDGTDDLRESPQIDLLGRLVDAGFKVLAHDRNVNTAGVRLAGGYLKAATPLDADCPAGSAGLADRHRRRADPRLRRHRRVARYVRVRRRPRSASPREHRHRPGAPAGRRAGPAGLSRSLLVTRTKPKDRHHVEPDH